MRLSRLELLAYGHFRGLALDFSAPGLHVVLGRNEAGKSTTLRAIAGLLYGIDRNTGDAHLHKPADLRIGGTLERGGERLRVVRRKGNTNTLLDPQEKPIDEASLRRMLGGVTQETFIHAYGLDHDTLAKGAESLLEGKGDLGESLFDAGVGGGGEVQRLLAHLAREADAIYRPRGTSLPLNEAMNAFALAAKQVREQRTLPEAYKAQEDGLALESEQRTDELAKKKELELRKALIVRARARAPRERQRDHLAKEQSKLGAVPMHLARIDALKDRFGGYERDVEQLRAHRSEVERLGERLKEAMRRAGIEGDVAGADGANDGLESFRVDVRKEGKVNALMRERAKLLERVDATTNEIGRAERALAQLQATGPTSTDPATRDALAQALDRARKLGDIEDRITTERLKLDRQERALAAKATTLAARVMWLEEPKRSRSKTSRGRTVEPGPELAAFVALSLPASEALDALEAKGNEVTRKLARAEERAVELAEEGASLEKEIATNSGDFAPPDVAVLREARRARDDAWQTVRDTDAKKRAAAEVKLEGLLREADAVADRMIREADRVTTLARLRAELHANVEQLQRARAEQTKLGAAERALALDLAKLFAPAEIVPGEDTDRAEMRTWLERHEQIAEEHARLVDARAATDAEATKAMRAAADLAAVLAPKAKKTPSGATRTAARDEDAQFSLFEAGGSMRARADASASDAAPNKRTRGRAATAEPVANGAEAAPRGDAHDAELPGERVRLGELIATATARLAALDEARRVAAAVADQERTRDERSELRDRCQEQLREIAKELATLLGPLGLGAHAPADEVNRAIEALREVFALADKRADEANRARAAAAAATAFEAELSRCIADVAPDLAAADGAAPADLRTSARVLFERARVARENESALSTVEAQLAELGEPVTAAALEGIADLEAAEAELAEQIDELDRDLARRTELIGALKRGLEQFRGSADAADAANAAQEHLARVRDHAERWARAKLAQVILAREIERYREENQGPLLASSSALFARLTLRKYSGIKAGFDDKDRPCLRCVRDDGSEVDVTALSDGTRDSLYLSLRLASVLRRADAAEPMPLILDDVLIQLDDQRAAAALEVLAEVARTMQVLFFTHHARLVDLARSAVAPSELVIHELSATTNVSGLAAVLG